MPFTNKVKWVLAVREPVVMKPSRLKYRGTRPLQFLPLFPFLVLIHTYFSRVGCDQAADKRAGRVHYEKKREVAQHLHFTHTVRQA